MLGLRKPYVCQEMVELITDYLEGSLTRSERRRFEAHIAACEHCSAYLDQMRLVVAATGQLRAADLTLEMREEFSEIFRRWQSEAD